MEVGKYIDFHDTGSSSDYDLRLTATKGNLLANGTLTASNLKSDNETRLASVEKNKANLSHTHTCSDITDLEEKLKNLGTTTTTHTHTCSDITDLEEKLKGKADSAHTHTCSDITDLEEKLKGKADSVHTHTCSDITDLNVNKTKFDDLCFQQISDISLTNMDDRIWMI